MEIITITDTTAPVNWKDYPALAIKLSIGKEVYLRPYIKIITDEEGWNEWYRGYGLTISENLESARYLQDYCNGREPTVRQLEYFPAKPSVWREALELMIKAAISDYQSGEVIEINDADIKNEFIKEVISFFKKTLHY